MTRPCHTNRLNRETLARLNCETDSSQLCNTIRTDCNSAPKLAQVQIYQLALTATFPQPARLTRDTKLPSRLTRDAASQFARLSIPKTTSSPNLRHFNQPARLTRDTVRLPTRLTRELQKLPTRLTRELQKLPARLTRELQTHFASRETNQKIKKESSCKPDR